MTQEEIDKLIISENEFMGEGYLITKPENEKVIKDYVLSLDDIVKHDFTEELEDRTIRMWFV